MSNFGRTLSIKPRLFASMYSADVVRIRSAVTRAEELPGDVSATIETAR
ncbi:MAG: hypothetical protein HY820_14325 [Acidobacteria bacterium]|nr:hypothetical protein [Acidobacteriota bacterium]